jgi:sulfofructose kinase
MTMGANGMLWYRAGSEERLLPTFSVPRPRGRNFCYEADIHPYFAYPFCMCDDHFRFADAASTHALRHLGTEASLPTLPQINEAHARFDERREGLRLVVAKSAGIKDEAGAEGVTGGSR